jgi:hypothetical protein
VRRHLIVVGVGGVTVIRMCEDPRVHTLVEDMDVLVFSGRLSSRLCCAETAFESNAGNGFELRGTGPLLILVSLGGVAGKPH